MSQVAQWFAIRRERRLVAALLIAAVSVLAYLVITHGPEGPAQRLSDVERAFGLTDVGGRLFFTADPFRGSDLWMSDGTSVGTFIVKHFHPRTYVGTPVDVDGTAFFGADDGEHGYELWRSDGTDDGTVMVKDIRPGPESSGPGYIVAAGGSFLFVANDGMHGRELWRSDGTAAGTTMLRNIWRGTSHRTGAGRRRAAFLAQPSHLTYAAGRTFFSAGDGEHGTELWMSDGAASSTVMVRDIQPGPGDSAPRSFVFVDGMLLFTAVDGTHGRALWRSAWDRELWRSDGTAAGTFKVQDIGRGEYSSVPTGLTVIDDTLYFSTLSDAVPGIWALPLEPTRSSSPS